VNGFVIESPEAVGELADRVRRLADAELRHRMGSAAAGIAERVSMRRHAEQTVDLYEELAQGSQAP
jgi:glycosyltransferase involved in cell wall biosynthesis